MRNLLASLLVFCCTIFCPVLGQLTLHISNIPTSTPPDALLYFAGNTNNWNPGLATSQFTKNPNNTYTLVLNPQVGLIEFKITRGSWATAEGTTSGAVISNRSVQYTGAPLTLQISIAGWEDKNGSTPVSTAAANVSVIATDFAIPQLNKTRRVWVYLPPDYMVSTQKHYPVLYCTDGQNAFDLATSAFGEWQIDESLNALFASGDYGAIAVAVDHGGTDRLNEYSPWVNSQYGGGQGDEMLTFMTETLKPYIDAHYRTFPDAAHTAIVGSSMGGLFAQYAFTEAQDVFGKAAVFSPAFWFADQESRQHVITTGKKQDGKVYYLAGGQEPASVATNMQAVQAAMLQVGYPSNAVLSAVVPDGAHSEWFWRREFPSAYAWLFQGVSNSSEPQQATKWKITPNPSQEFITIKAPKSAVLTVHIFSQDGKLVQTESHVHSGQRILINHLPAGVYYAHLQSAQAKTVRTFVKSQ